MSKLREAVQFLEDSDMEPMLLLGSPDEVNDFADAFVGVSMDNSTAIYNENKVIEVFIKRDGMTDIEAVEYYEYNVLGAYMGENTPIYIQEDF